MEPCEDCQTYQEEIKELKDRISDLENAVNNALYELRNV